MSDREHSRSISRSRSRSRDRKNDRRTRSLSKGARRNSRYRSKSRSPKYSKRYSRSRSRSRSYDRSSNDSRSSRRNGKPDINVLKSKCLGVFGLSIFTKETQIRDIFSRFGPLERVQIIFDAKTGRSRGYCFVYFENHEDAKRACEQCSGMELDDRRIRVDFSITQRAHSPTPGVYMGKLTKSVRPKTSTDRSGGVRSSSGGERSRYKDDRSRRHSKRRSPSPYRERRKRYERSRSRSHSPRGRRNR